MPSFTSSLLTLAERLFVAKGVWGSDYTNFMGISSGDDSGTISGERGSWGNARSGEPYVFRAQEVRASAIVQVPLRIYQVDAEGNTLQAVPHPALDVIKTTNPVGWVSGASNLLAYTLTSMDGWGYACWSLAFNGRKQPTEIYYETPDSIIPLHGYDIGRPDIAFAGFRKNGTVSLTPDKIVRFGTRNPVDPIMGQSKVALLRDTINLRRYSVRSNLDFFKNSMRPDWILTGDFANTQENMDRLLRQIRKRFGGENNRSPLIAGTNMKAQLLTMSQKDAEWLAQQRLAQEEIAMAYGVPVMYLNNLERSTYDNQRTSKLVLWHDTMIPECDAIAGTLSSDFLWRFWPETMRQNLEFRFDYRKIEGLGEDLNLVWERFLKYMAELDKMVNSRTMTPNQARAALEDVAGQLGVTPDPWMGDVYANEGDINKPNPGDTHYLLHTHIPVQQISAQMVIDAGASRGTNPELVESIPGAPNASQNSQRAVDRISAAKARAEADAKPPPDPTTPPDGTPPPPASPPSKPPGKAFSAKAAEPDLDKLQESMIRALKRHFQDQKNESLRTLRAQTVDQLNANRELFDLWAASEALVIIVRQFAERASAKAFEASATEYGLDVSWRATDPWLDHYMGGRLNLIHGISDTTQKTLKSTLLEGAQAGDSMDRLAGRVSNVYREAIDHRAKTIARTETMNAYGRASLHSYRLAGLTEAQMVDGSADPTCAARDGKVVSLAAAERELDAEHPNGRLVVIPVLRPRAELGFPAVIIDKAYAAETRPRPTEHMHDYGQNLAPVLAFDLHRTQTPDIGFPLTAAPFDGLQTFLSRQASRGCCIHTSSASMDTTDRDLFEARLAQIQGWNRQYGLPVSWISANSDAFLRIDDRGIAVPPNPDWVTDLPAQIEAKLLAGPWILQDGVYGRHSLTPIGDPVEVWPDLDKLPRDRPRGHTAQMLDFDIHRTVCPAWGSSRQAPYDMAGVELVNRLYDAGYQIQMSCGGWNPSLVDDDTRKRRLGAITWSLLDAGVRYDRVVSKEDCDIWIDDKVMPPPVTPSGEIDWALLEIQILARVGPPASMPAHGQSLIPNQP